jgi:hypothetical protein
MVVSLLFIVLLHMKDHQKPDSGYPNSDGTPRPQDSAETSEPPSPALIEFAKAPAKDGADEELWPLPQELLRNRREWAKTIKENTRAAGDLHGDKGPESKPTPERDPPQR